MKKLYLSALVLIFGISLYAQPAGFDRLYYEYKGEEGVVALRVPGFVMKLAASVADLDRDALVQEIENLDDDDIRAVLSGLAGREALRGMLARLQPKTLVVVRSGLGTLNHTLLTLEALQKRNIPVLGIVFSDPEMQEDERLVQDNMRTIEEIGLVKVFGRLQRHQNIDQSRAAFMAVGQAILEQLNNY